MNFDGDSDRVLYFDERDAESYPERQTLSRRCSTAPSSVSVVGQPRFKKAKNAAQKKVSKPTKTKKNKMSEKELRVLLDYYEKFPSRWNMIANIMRIDDPNYVKNQFFSLVRRGLRKANRLVSKQKFESLLENVKPCVLSEFVLEVLPVSPEFISLVKTSSKKQEMTGRDFIELFVFKRKSRQKRDANAIKELTQLVIDHLRCRKAKTTQRSELKKDRTVLQLNAVKSIDLNCDARSTSEMAMTATPRTLMPPNLLYLVEQFGKLKDVSCSEQPSRSDVLRLLREISEISNDLQVETQVPSQTTYARTLEDGDRSITSGPAQCTAQRVSINHAPLFDGMNARGSASFSRVGEEEDKASVKPETADQQYVLTSEAFAPQHYFSF